MAITAPEKLPASMLTGAERAGKLAVTLLPSYVIWGGVLELLSASRADEAIAKFCSPVVSKLFPDQNDEVRRMITMTFVANMLGMNGAATQLGTSTTAMMDDGSERITRSQATFAVVNATSLSLLPTTVIALRSVHGSSSPADIVLPSIIVSAVATVLAVLLVRIFCK